jgi:hypothetical protein
MADGHLNKCKDCVRSRVSAHRDANIDAVRAYDRRRFKLPERRKYVYQRAQSYVATHVKARVAHTMVSNAIRDGRMNRSPCESCGSKANIHAHHDDYDKPLTVRWLCVICHAEWHRANGPGANLDD